MKYNVGDKVRIKSLDWYNENKDENGNIYCGDGLMLNPYNAGRFCGRILTIKEVNNDFYTVVEDCSYWNDNMIEGLVEEETKPNIIEQAKTYWDSIKDAWVCPEGYHFKDENGNIINAKKIVLEKKNKYPKSYKECCKILGIEGSRLIFNSKDITEYEENLICKIGKLEHIIVCRDAYWKIAGEEMGLGKPWEPDWDAKDNHFCTIYTFNGKIECSATAHRNAVLIFPTEEMGDAFKENFDPDIEICKEFL